jgi:hypothetical protein
MTNTAKVLYIDAGRSLPDSDVLVQANYSLGTMDDISVYQVPVSTNGTVTLSGGTANFEGGQCTISYNGFQGQHSNKSYTMEAFVTLSSGSGGVADQIVMRILGDAGGSDWRIIAEPDTGDLVRPLGYYGRSTAVFPIGTGPNVWAAGVEHHLCFMYDADTGMGYILINGVLEAEADCGTAPHLPSGAGELRLGGNITAGVYRIREARLSLGFKYDREGFTPPSTLPDPSGDIGNARFVERPVQWQNLANVESRGGQLTSQTFKFHGFSNAETASRSAARVSA